MTNTFEKNKLHSYLGKHLVECLKDAKAYIAGGTITSLYSNREINDIDVYFRDEKSAIKFIARMIEDNGAWVVSHTNKATQMSYSNGSETIDVQAIHFNYFESTGQLFDSFDFSAVMGAFDFLSDEFIFGDEFLKHNSQRILKFNSNTSYPIVSMLRVQKYEERGYKISKAEFIRIILTCMNLDIQSYDDLKEHLGGMYGESFDSLFKDIEEETFSLQVAIDKIADLALSEDYFKPPVLEDFNLSDIIKNISKEPVTYINIKDKHYEIGYMGLLNEIEGKPEENFIEVSAEKFLSENRFYKNVKKLDTGYFSFHNGEFEYKILEQAVARNDNRNDGKLYFREKDDFEHATFGNRSDRAVLEVIISPNDFISAHDGEVYASKCYVVREVPEEEYSAWGTQDEVKNS